ncbi:FAD dependent oxidoreductase [Natrinema pellirubrum DSM 15624]|uniref:FAD dependent oxidoreductase n=1 Tax=Natrinema pellirubrum (strain DSM 15624 / CIP 106293 / JCM 10476 / NCIMB 786 / 157) TaxID=797303 RepID=L0JJP1_NATP1|nr:digeranylgeranylglycerophospholipid reductase [Natrinema pellirubrum]AGB30571.1 flavin-dependent dehydrogenase [Natrinema pellirubrum DSM 15624]ELY74954.1 FAD dependent oxidoreductase [Natrinema pellirubrum DSM 15624]
MNDRYDVVIAGAGPAGAQCARDIAARGYDVVVLETEAEDEFPRQSNKSTAGTFHSMMSAFGIPDDVVMQYTDSVVLESPTEHYVRDQPGAVLEFADFKRYLVADGRETGAEYRFDARVTAPIMEGGEIAGVRYNGDEEVYGDIVIDATGPSAPLAKKLDVVDLKRENHAIGIEYEFEGIDIDRPGFADLRDAMMLRLDHEIAPGGYSWIFHTGEDTAKVGLCYIQNEHHSRYAKDGHTIDDYMEHWLETDPRFSEAEKIAGKQHRGSAHIQKPGQLHTDRFMAIGDTVPTVDPLWGEGINKCMQSGRVAAMAADSCLKHDDIEPTAENLAVYDTLWHRDVAPNVDNRLLMTRLLYLAPNERYDKLMRDLERLDDDTLAKANKGNFRAIARLLELEDAPLLVQLAKQHLDLDLRSLV